jgi:hypothetical protein
MCDTCRGPHATDCVTCVVNAFRDSTTGACSCPESRWTGDSCNVRQYECDANCLECDIDTSDDASAMYNNCTQCADGYYKSNENTVWYTCEPCIENCKTCELDEGDKCLTCFDGYTPVNDFCVPCAPNCATCSPGN